MNFMSGCLDASADITFKSLPLSILTAMNSLSFPLKFSIIGLWYGVEIYFRASSNREPESESKGISSGWRLILLSICFECNIYLHMCPIVDTHRIQVSCIALNPMVVRASCIWCAYTKKSVGSELVARPTTGGSDIAHWSWTSNAEAHACICNTLSVSILHRIGTVSLRLHIHGHLHCLIPDSNCETVRFPVVKNQAKVDALIYVFAVPPHFTPDRGFCETVCIAKLAISFESSKFLIKSTNQVDREVRFSNRGKICFLCFRESYICTTL